ncbi:MAG: hypothetical protein ACK4IY_06175 [Chitinophagales bacterium]
MKEKLIIGISLFLILSIGSVQAQNAKLTIKYRFKGIEQGYDHTTQTKVFIDGNELCAGNEHKQSKPSAFTCMVPSGKHDVLIMNYAYYEGTWEEHTIANNYSIDCLLNREMTFREKKKYSIKLLFDIESGTIVKKIK